MASAHRRCGAQMSPAGAIGVNVAIATAAVAAQELYPLFGRGPILHADLRSSRRAQRRPNPSSASAGAQRVLVAKEGGLVRRLLPRLLPIMLNSPLATRSAPAVLRGAAATARSGVRVRGVGGSKDPPRPMRQRPWLRGPRHRDRAAPFSIDRPDAQEQDDHRRRRRDSEGEQASPSIQLRRLVDVQRRRHHDNDRQQRLANERDQQSRSSPRRAM